MTGTLASFTNCNRFIECGTLVVNIGPEAEQCDDFVYRSQIREFRAGSLFLFQNAYMFSLNIEAYAN